MTISRILVANRGEIARRVFRTCRQMGIATVAVHSTPDSSEPHSLEADQAVHLPGAAPAETYLDIDRVVAAAKETGADAVHPGYGFLAENPDFARSVTGSGLVWIGPSPESIEVMGSKLRSKRLVESVGVPTLGGVEVAEIGEARAAADRIGYPLLVKASAGGGGKGMRIVTRPGDLEEAVWSCRREAAAAFGDDTVFLEEYLEDPRHIEIQVFGDQHGEVVSLFERECSIQRRHQKIIEESPSPAIDEQAREEMSRAAVEVARAVEYLGAGTVEFLFHQGRFWFLEMNTRLQVEHPVTEMVTGLDLVRLQIEVAMGGRVPAGSTMGGHAIEARLYAEDPLNGFLPVTGTFHRLAFPEVEGLRVDSGIEAGSVVSVHYDPMVAKVIAHGPAREQAAAVLADALRRAEVCGPVTNRALLIRILEHPEFLRGQTDTGFLERNSVDELARPLLTAEEEAMSAVAAALSDQAAARATAPALPSIPSGWRNMPGASQERAYLGEHRTHQVRYSLNAGVCEVEGMGRLRSWKATPDRVSWADDGEVSNFRIHRHGSERYVESAAGIARLVERPRFPDTRRQERAGSLQAPMPGRVIRVEVSAGDPVAAGQALVILEAMKMEHTLRAPRTGTVAEVRCPSGAQVVAGDILVVVDEGD